MNAQVDQRLIKDAWIADALHRQAIIARADGSIWRVKVTDGVRKPVKIKVSTHKKSGRVYFNLTHDGMTKSVLVNRVIALAFHPNPFNLPEVNHIDGDKQNNAKDNLEWSNRSEQEKHAFATGLKSNRGTGNSNAKLNAQSVLAIRESKRSNSELAQQFKVSVATIRAIRENKTWRHV